jgi:Fic family protein
MDQAIIKLYATNLCIQELTLGQEDNIIKAVTYITKYNNTINESLLFTINSLVLTGKEDTINSFRKIDVKPAMCQSGTYAPSWIIKAKIKQLLSLINNHKDENILNIYLEFLTIHPFIDGNGRTAHILINVINLRRNQCLLIPSIHISREEFLKCFELARNKQKNQQKNQFNKWFNSHSIVQILS